MNRTTTSTFKIIFFPEENIFKCPVWTAFELHISFLEDLTYSALHLAFEGSVVENLIFPKVFHTNPRTLGICSNSSVSPGQINKHRGGERMVESRMGCGICKNEEWNAYKLRRPSC